MALSQLQCLDNNNVNWRSSETKPEFFYSEEQRLALEALVASGQDAFYQVVKKENIRDFLSELEVTDIESRVEPFDPDSNYPRKSVSEGEEDPEEDVEHSLEYWPDRSDCSIPELDLGWPDTVAYRGVTRAAVYMQPPIDGQPHIKEVVRKMITQAQRVIAVVMDLFTDVDIFKDMLDAGFKRKISVYIILNESQVKYFLQMCEKAQMHRGHLKNLRIRSIGGAEFYTRVSTKFKGSLGQKFMFVDGDKTVCGSYSFTWSAARIDRNLITVLSGQVVETFDRQFQELYLLSKGVSLKNVTMDNEPEPEPMIQPASLPPGQSEAIARKMINPKYALVSVKSASEAGKDSKKEAELAKKMAPRPRVIPVEQQMYEQQIHPALQDMERADMFEYLPTWVEPDPEPGSDILGYINIVDPKIWNAQPSQMNRIKICDTSQATAQYLQQTRDNEIMRQRSESPSAKNMYRGPSHEQDGPNQSTSMEADRSPSRGHPLRQNSQEHGSIASSTKNSISRQASQEEPMPREDGTIRQHDGEVIASYETQEILSPQNFSESIASLAANHHLVSRNSSSGSASGKPPPVPKPRTLQVTDFITMKNAINTRSLRSSTSTDENTVPSVNGVDAEGREAEEIDIIIESEPNDQDEDDAGMFRSCPAEYSSSGSGSLPPSNASSMSEEYYPSGSLHRRSSERISNGERPLPHRKLSDGHISRGSFLSPLNISHSLMEMNPSENGKKRTMLEEYVISSNPLQRKERLYGLDNSQGKQHFQYTTNGPTGGFDRFHSHPGSRSVGRAGKKDAMEGPGAYRQLSRKSDNPGARPGYWSGKDYGSSYANPHSQSPAPPETATTPFGIPYSKLSQAKHLKNKIGAGTLDSRRRGHGPPGHKDL